MKNALKLFAGSVIVIAGLVACGKKGGGGGGGASAPAYGAGCISNGNGLCVGGFSNGSAFVGAGVWSGRLTINNVQTLNQMYQDMGRCGFRPNYPTIQNQFAFQCIQASALKVSVSIVDGQVPGTGRFVITPMLNGRSSRQKIQQTADAFLTSANNGFMLVHTPFAGQQFFPQFPGQPGIQQAGAIQIVSTWADASRTLLNTQLIYRNIVVASGQIWNPNSNQYGYQTSSYSY